jgi:hypothetical protein
MSRRSHISGCALVGSVILFTFPRLDRGLFYSTYILLINGVMKITEKTLLYQVILCQHFSVNVYPCFYGHVFI